VSKLRVGVIGCGNKNRPSGPLGYHMAWEHANAYKLLDSCEMVACADIVEENARAYADAYAIPGVYLDYQQMLEAEKLDVVSICTWMHLHEPMVLAAIAAGAKVIHCEKPMADTWGGAKRMAAAADAAGTKLTFNHQRRYGQPYVLGKKLLEDGVIGDLVRQESACGNLYDGGTHFIDMMSFFQGEVPAKWVIAQIDYRQENLIFGSHNENQQVCLWQYENGVYGTMMSGAGGAGPIGAVNVLEGTRGVIQVGVPDGPALRYRTWGDAEWIVPDVGGESIHGPMFIERAIADVIDCYLQGRKCQLDASNALIATELIFGSWESSRRRGRVDFPLDAGDNALAAMVESGDLKPAKG
jgi:UDP-N-acetylglucosamine 3-dehydrogenase